MNDYKSLNSDFNKLGKKTHYLKPFLAERPQHMPMQMKVLCLDKDNNLGLNWLFDGIPRRIDNTMDKKTKNYFQNTTQKTKV